MPMRKAATTHRADMRQVARRLRSCALKKASGGRSARALEGIASAVSGVLMFWEPDSMPHVASAANRQFRLCTLSGRRVPVAPYGRHMKPKKRVLRILCRPSRSFVRITMLPSVSVIMAAYNGERHVREAVDSILAQSLGDLELIAVDDASTDATWRVLASCPDSRLRVLRNSSRLGAAASRNRAIQTARAPLIAIQDADDVSLPQRLQTQAEFLGRNPSVDLVGAWAISISHGGREIGLLSYPPRTDLNLKWALLFWNPFIHSSVMLRRSMLAKVGSYREGRGPAWFVEDYELFSRVARLHQAANIGQALIKYRVHPAGASARHADLLRFSEEVSLNNVKWLLGGKGIDEEAVH